jgi:NAD(P)-dependent dehydrogenase (short-subunit alcohol dehydrogenase family)
MSAPRRCYPFLESSQHGGGWMPQEAIEENFANRVALIAGARLAAYSAAKAALLRLTESMAAELKSSGINVNCVLPGTLDTPENRRDRPDADFSTWGALEAVADVILFLTSAAARSVHGAAIPVLGLS